MLRPVFAVVVALPLMTTPPAAQAWNAAGHMTVAKLAWDQLDAKDRATLIELLKEHPHWEKFFLAAGKAKDVPDADVQFALASTWADWLRGFAKSPDAEGKKIYAFHKGPRHYINWPFVHPADVEMFQGKDLPIDPKDDIIRGLTTVMGELKATDKFSPKYRAVSLCWLLHLVGDVHQPLHNVALYSAEIPTGDQGGNLFWVKDAGVPTRLHGYWDDLFGREDYDAHIKSYDRAVTACARLTRPDFAKEKFLVDFQKATFEDWSKDGFRLAVDVGYRNGKLPGRIIIREHESDEEKAKAPPLPDDYGTIARATADRQAALAGYRLAVLLKQVAAATRGKQ
jgi:hypothetical protein